MTSHTCQMYAVLGATRVKPQFGIRVVVLGGLVGPSAAGGESSA